MIEFSQCRGFVYYDDGCFFSSGESLNVGEVNQDTQGRLVSPT